MTDPSSVVRGISHEPVTRWLVANVAGVSPPFRFQIIEGGHSNITYRVEDGLGRRLVLRRPPIGSLLATAHDMAREHRIIAALAQTAVPVPAALGLCEDESVNDAPFYVMDFVDGVVLDTSAKAAANFDESQRWKLGESVIRVLADLHSVDPDEVGLGTLGKKESYIPRQLRRWRKQWNASKTRELPAMEQVADFLESEIPPQQGATVVHGDYRLGNMISAADARVGAVLDWELCTLGDPMADLGYLLNNWAEPGDSQETSPEMAMPPSAAGGFPSRSEVLLRYAEATGRDVSRVAYYQAFQHWRLAAICEGVLDRYLQGKMAGQVDTDLYSRRVETMAQAAVSMIDGL